MAESMAAGYVGGYTAKMQPIGANELKRKREALDRKISVEKSGPAPEEFKKYSRHLLKDLEAKGVARTNVETTLLALAEENSGPTAAECVRTFPDIAFPASLLLKREVVETGKRSGTSIIAAIHRAGGRRKGTFVEAPFDLMYGFRGSAFESDLNSPY